MVVPRPRVWPVCIAGKWSAPPEGRGNGISYMNNRQRIRHPLETIDLLVSLVDEPVEELGQFRARFKHIAAWRQWMHFDRRQRNTSFRRVGLAWDEENEDEVSFAIGG